MRSARMHLAHCLPGRSIDLHRRHNRRHGQQAPIRPAKRPEMQASVKSQAPMTVSRILSNRCSVSRCSVSRPIREPGYWRGRSPLQESAYSAGKRAVRPRGSHGPGHRRRRADSVLIRTGTSRPLRSRADSPSKTYAFRRPKFRDVRHAPPTSKLKSRLSENVNSTESCWDMWELAYVDAAFAAPDGDLQAATRF